MGGEYAHDSDGGAEARRGKCGSQCRYASDPTIQYAAKNNDGLTDTVVMGNYPSSNTPNGWPYIRYGAD